MAKEKPSEIDLQELKEELLYNWKVRTADQYSTTMVAYIDARDVQERLDKVCGPENWQCEFYELKGRIFCKIGIFLGGQWVWKSDCGKETKIEGEKGEASDAFKRAAVHWGIGRFLYDLPELRWRETIERGKTRKGDPAYRFAHNGEIVWDKAKITALCNERMKSIKAGKVVDEPAPPPSEKPAAAKPATQKPKPSAKGKDLTPDEIIALTKKMREGLGMLTNNGSQKEMEDKLEELSGFETKDRKTGEDTFIPGKRSLRELAKSPRRLKPTWSRIKKEMEKQGGELPEDMQSDKPVVAEQDDMSWVDQEPGEDEIPF